jgi:hypothetical protein
MIIVRIIGGLGNQMFQYAFYKMLKEKFPKVKADIHGYETYKLHTGFSLEEYFDVNIDFATIEEVNSVTNIYKKSIIFKIIRKLFGNKESHIEEANFNLNCLNDEGSFYLDGYWQSDNYFSNKDSLASHFKFKLQPKDIEGINNIDFGNAISLHVRRGDYVGNSVYCQSDAAYYVSAMEYLVEKFDNVVFYVFSDDLLWAEKELLESYTSKFSLVFSVNKNTAVIDDLQLMSLCKHNIIANSSFSWWGAWLNKNNNKIVIYPKKWYNNPKTNSHHINQMPKNWLGI